MSDPSSNCSAIVAGASERAMLARVRNVVVKLGTQVLSDADGKLDSGFVSAIADQVAQLRRRKITVTIVSSGAIGAGLRVLGLTRRPTDLAKLQAVAAVGQRRLMDVWASAFAPHAAPVAQLLLTREDIDHRARFLNLRNTIHAAHELGAVPVINENDTISTDELVKISFGDNDILAGLVASALRADLLVLLSNVDGVLDAQGNPVRALRSVDSASAMVRPEKSALGKGGMDSKLAAARMVTHSGEMLVVANGRMPDVLNRIIAGEEVGTLFLPPAARSGAKRPSRSRWIGAARPVGSIVVDEGAARALVEKNRSLLPAGIVKVEGEFDRGDVVAIVTSTGQRIARGLSNYASEQVEQIRGRKTAEVRALLSDAAYDEVVHRDNLLVEG